MNTHLINKINHINNKVNSIENIFFVYGDNDYLSDEIYTIELELKDNVSKKIKNQFEYLKKYIKSTINVIILIIQFQFIVMSVDMKIKTKYGSYDERNLSALIRRNMMTKAHIRSIRKHIFVISDSHLFILKCQLSPLSSTSFHPHQQVHP